MYNFRKIICGIFLLGLWACSEPEVIIPPYEVPTTSKKVLVEELTGVRCPNCPSAAARLEAIQQIYGKNVIAVNIHGDLLTKPLDESQFDFRNPDASALEDSFKPFIGKPSVVINRKTHPSFSLMANPLQDQWQPIIEEELQLPQRVSLIHDLVEEERGWKLNIAIVPLEDLPGEYRLHVILVENNIIDAQEDVDRIITEYVHNHILRKVLTNLEGERIADRLEREQRINQTIGIDNSILDPEWKIDQLELIYFITDQEGAVEEVELLSFLE